MRQSFAKTILFQRTLLRSFFLLQCFLLLHRHCFLSNAVSFYLVIFQVTIQTLGMSRPIGDLLVTIDPKCRISAPHITRCVKALEQNYCYE